MYLCNLMATPAGGLEFVYDICGIFSLCFRIPSLITTVTTKEKTNNLICIS